MSETTTPVTRRWPFLALAAAAFALLMTVGPIVATQGVDAGGSEDAYAGNNVGMLAARQGASLTTAPGTPAASPFVVPAFAATPGASLPASVGSEPTPAEPVEPVEAAATEPIDGGAIVLEVGISDSDLSDGATTQWLISITNEGDEYLWGVYAYLEGYGEISCADRQLAIGQSTSCTARGKVFAGDHVAEAWATAWTINRMVEASATIPYTVAG